MIKHVILFAAAFLATRLFATETLLTIDRERSHIEAAAKSTMEDFTAKLSYFEGTIQVDPTAKSVGSAQLKFRFADVKTGSNSRDAKMHRWQQTDQFPDCVYVLDALLHATGGSFRARGKFIFHGITREISFPVTLRFEDKGICKIDGDLQLDTRQYELPIVRLLGVFTVAPFVQVKFHIEGHLPTSS
jgi:polyisoprenoid-binding protein YceI